MAGQKCSKQDRVCGECGGRLPACSTEEKGVQAYSVPVAIPFAFLNIVPARVMKDLHKVKSDQKTARHRLPVPPAPTRWDTIKIEPQIHTNKEQGTGRETIDKKSQTDHGQEQLIVNFINSLPEDQRMMIKKCIEEPIVKSEIEDDSDIEITELNSDTIDELLPTKTVSNTLSPPQTKETTDLEEEHTYEIKRDNGSQTKLVLRRKDSAYNPGSRNSIRKISRNVEVTDVVASGAKRDAFLRMPGNGNKKRKVDAILEPNIPPTKKPLMYADRDTFHTSEEELLPRSRTLSPSPKQSHINVSTPDAAGTIKLLEKNLQPASTDSKTTHPAVPSACLNDNLDKRLQTNSADSVIKCARLNLTSPDPDDAAFCVSSLKSVLEQTPSLLPTPVHDMSWRQDSYSVAPARMLKRSETITSSSPNENMFSRPPPPPPPSSVPWRDGSMAVNPQFPNIGKVTNENANPREHTLREHCSTVNPFRTSTEDNRREDNMVALIKNDWLDRPLYNMVNNMQKHTKQNPQLPNQWLRTPPTPQELLSMPVLEHLLMHSERRPLPPAPSERPLRAPSRYMPLPPMLAHPPHPHSNNAPPAYTMPPPAYGMPPPPQTLARRGRSARGGYRRHLQSRPGSHIPQLHPICTSTSHPVPRMANPNMHWNPTIQHPPSQHTPLGSTTNSNRFMGPATTTHNGTAQAVQNTTVHRLSGEQFAPIPIEEFMQQYTGSQ